MVLVSDFIFGGGGEDKQRRHEKRQRAAAFDSGRKLVSMLSRRTGVVVGSSNLAGCWLSDPYPQAEQTNGPAGNP